MKILLSLLFLTSAALLPAGERPKVLLIFADDIGYEVLNSYGGRDFETPDLNRMAEQGLRFSRAHTSPVCTPSRVSLHTGLYVTRHGHTTVFDLFPTLCELTGTEVPSSIAIDGRSIAAQIHGKPGIPREWVHHALSARHGGETLFDGNSRLFRNNGKLIDARALPMENPADMKDPDAIAAKASLTAVFKEITIDGPRPPEPFSTSPGKASTHQPATR